MYTTNVDAIKYRVASKLPFCKGVSMNVGTLEMKMEKTTYSPVVQLILEFILIKLNQKMA